MYYVIICICMYLYYNYLLGSSIELLNRNNNRIYINNIKQDMDQQSEHYPLPQSYQQQQQVSRPDNAHGKSIIMARSNIKYLVILLITMMMVCPIQCDNNNNNNNNMNDNDDEYSIMGLQNGTDTIQKILSYVNGNAVYDGQYQSLQSQSILDWITQKQGQLHLSIQPSTQYLLSSYQQQNTEQSISNRFDLFIDKHNNKYNNNNNKQGKQLQTVSNNDDNNIVGDVGQMQRYSVQLLFLNPRYITQQVLIINFNIDPSKFKHTIIQDNTYVDNDDEQYGNTTVQKCYIISDNEWQCSNTQANYTKLWRRQTLDDDLHLLRINYTMRIQAQQHTDANYDYTQFKFTIQLMSAIVSYQMGESVNVDVDGLASELIHFRTVNPLKLRTRALPLTFYSLFITAMIVIQIVSARLVNRKLTQNHGMASKLSLFVLSFCTIADLSGTIDFAYRMFQTSNVYYRIILFFPTVSSAILYFGFDVQVLTRVLITQFNQRAFVVGLQNTSFKKVLIAFYIAFFLSYEGYVLLKAFFQYQWWFVFITSCCILVPQIVRNVRAGNGGDGAFDYWYVLGFLATRSLIVVYQHACPQNYLKIKPYLALAIILCIFLVLQVVILYCQSKLSARFFIPNFLRPNYHKYSQKIKLSQLQDSEAFECVICLQRLSSAPQSESEQSSPQLNQSLQENILDRSIQIYKTPCGHMFHEDCLKSWMGVKLECPTCRSKLPML